VSLGCGLAVAILAACGAPASAQVTANYTGATNGFYNTAGNWDIGTVPINSGPTTYNVVIPASRLVNYDVPGATPTIRSLSLPANSTLNVQTGRVLRTTNADTIAGFVSVTGAGASFTGQAGASNLTGGAFQASTTGAISLAATSYTTSASGYNVFRATAGGTITAGGLASIQGSSIIGTVNVNADGAGVVTLPALTSATGPTTSGWQLRFFADGAGSRIDIPVLASIANRGTIEVANGAVINAGSFNSLVGDFLHVRAAGSTFNSAPVTAINDGTIWVGDGATYLLGSATSYNSLGSGGYTPFRAYNGGTLTASSLASMDLSTSPGTVTIQSDGTNSLLSLPVLNSVLASNTSGWTTRFFASGTNARITLTVLPQVTNIGTYEAASGGVINAPALNSLRSDFVHVRGAGSAFVTPPVTAIDAAVFWAGDGGAYSVAGATAYNSVSTSSYTPLRAYNGGTLTAPALTSMDLSSSPGTVNLQADAANALLTLPVLSSLTATTTNGWTTRVFASGAGARVNVPALPQVVNRGTYEAAGGGTISATALNSLRDDFVIVRDAGSAFTTPTIAMIDGAAFWAGDGGSYTLPGSTTYNSGGAGGYTVLRAYNGGTLSSSTLQSADLSTSPGAVSIQADGSNARVSLTALNSLTASTVIGWTTRIASNGAGCRIDVPALPQIVNRGTFEVSGGGVINAGSLSSLRDDFVHIRNAGSALNAPLLLSIDGAAIWAGDSASYTTQAASYSSAGANSLPVLRAYNGSTLNATSLSAIDCSSGTGVHSFSADSGDSLLDLTGLVSAVGPSTAGWAVRFNAQGAGSRVLLPAGVTFTDNFFYEAADGGTIRTDSRVASAGTSIRNSGTLSAGADVSFIATNINLTEGIIAFRNTGVAFQRFEVAGREIGIPGDLTNNIRLGRLVVGEAGNPTTVTLCDCSDNGRRGAGGQPEALYLTGIGGGDGLTIASGSTLSLSGIQAYAFVGGAWVHLNSLIPANQDCVAFGGGSICRDYCPADINRDGTVDFFDYLDFVASFDLGASPADFNCDGEVDFFDYLDFVSRFDQEC
jgi:hypothetical protein